MTALFLLLCSLLPADSDALREQVVTIERAHLYDDDCKPVFTQWIFWRCNCGQEEVQAWRIEKEGFLWQRNPPLVMWFEQVNGMERLRIVKAGSFVESHEQYDKELLEREVFPKEWRKELRTR